eukprot:Sspe_Gene.110279::Locus_90715_Transcript_2_2_Confidence_0.333_Length_481::g.110279::m.110279
MENPSLLGSAQEQLNQDLAYIQENGVHEVVRDLVTAILAKKPLPADLYPFIVQWALRRGGGGSVVEVKESNEESSSEVAGPAPAADGGVAKGSDGEGKGTEGSASYTDGNTLGERGEDERDETDKDEAMVAQ